MPKNQAESIKRQGKWLIYLKGAVREGFDVYLNLKIYFTQPDKRGS